MTIHLSAAPAERFHGRRFVLTGAVRFTTGHESFVATPGRSVTAPSRHAAHLRQRRPGAPATLFCTISPAHYVDYFRQLAALPLTPEGRFDPADMRALAARYDVRPCLEEAR